MCSSTSEHHKIMGQRLNQSQGLFPKNKVGISVSIMRCKKCELIFSNPQPIPNSIQDHYGIPAADYWKPQYFDIDLNYFASPIKKARELLNSTQLSAPESIKALDVGAGLGKAMIAMNSAGFDIYGLEPSETFREMAISKMKIDAEKLKLGGVEDLDYPKESFDFITFGAVLEHLYHPAENLRKATEWLKPGGIIHAEIPSSNWLISKLLNLYYSLKGTNYVSNLSPMHVPFHLYEFSEKSFGNFAEKNNLEIAYYKVEVCTPYHIPKVLHPIFKWYMGLTKSGLQLIIYLRKK